MTSKTMGKFVTVIVTALLCFSLIGCNTNASEPKYNEEVAIKNRVEQFEKIRLGLRVFLARRAQEDPTAVYQMGVSLFDYEPITYLEEFEKKYPNVKIVNFQVHIKGSSSWSGTLNADKSIKEEIARVEEATYRSFSEGNDGYFDEILDAIKKGDVHTYAFEVRGQIKDLEALAKQEYDKKFRVVNLEGLLGNQWVGPYYEPIYAVYGDKQPDRSK